MAVSGGNYVDEKGPSRKNRVRLLLTCGHSIIVRIEPQRGTAKYACRQNLGCGYTLSWVSWRDEVSGREGKNMREGRN